MSDQVEVSISGYIVLIDAVDADIVSHHVSVSTRENRLIKIEKSADGTWRTVSVTRLIMERIIGRPLQRNELVDHVNRNTLDNRRANLRIATSRQNGANAKRRADNTSGYKGVSFNKGRQMWKAALAGRHIGYFPTAEAAYAAYCESARAKYGEFAYFGDTPSTTLSNDKGAAHGES